MEDRNTDTCISNVCSNIVGRVDVGGCYKGDRVEKPIQEALNEGMASSSIHGNYISSERGGS